MVWRWARETSERATDAARRETRKRGIYITEVEGTGFGGRIVVTDVRRTAAETEQEANGEREPEETNATNAVRQKTTELGMSLIGSEGTGYVGLVITKDASRSVANS